MTVAPAIALAAAELLEARNEIFNVGADTPYTVNYLAKVIAEAMGFECKVKHLDPRNEVKIAFSDHSKSELVFGGSRKTSLEEGIHGMAAWVKTHGARESSIFKGIEIMKNLPASWSAATER